MAENTNTSNTAAKLRFEMKRESPLDLSVKTVCRSADSTDDRLHPFGHDIPKVNFKPDFNACRGPSTSSHSGVAQPTIVAGSQQHNITFQVGPQQLALPLPLPLPTVMSSQQQQQNMSSLQVAAPTPTPLPPVVHHQQPLVLTSADDAWRAAIDRQIEQKFNSYTSSKKQHYHHPHFPTPPLPPQQQQQQQQQQFHQQEQQPQPQPLSPTFQQHQGPAQADKRVLEILKQNIEARDQSGRPQVAEAPSTPAMVFSTPVRKEPSTTPLKKTDYYMAERTAVTPFPKKIDYYMDRAYCNAPRIRTKAERKQVAAESSSSGTRMSSPMAAATAISPHPFLPSNNNSTPQTKQEQIPLAQTEVVMDTKLDIKREPSPIKDSDLCVLNKEDVEKDDDEEFWMNTCNSFVVQLAETQEKKKVKTPIKKKSLKEQLPQLPKRKYTKRIKIDPVSELEHDKKSTFGEEHTLKPTKELKSELEENVNKSTKTESLDMDKENKTKIENKDKTIDDIKEKDDEESVKIKPKKKRLFKPLPITKVKKISKEDKKDIKIKEIKKDSKKDLKKGDKKEMIKKDLLTQKAEKKELLAAAKEEKKLLKKEEKRDLKKEQQQENNKKDLCNNKKENMKKETIKKKVTMEKENATKGNENTARKLIVSEATSKFNPRQSLRRKNSLKDYTFAFDELLDDPFVHFEVDKIPVKRRRKCVSPSPPNLTPAVVITAPTQTTIVGKKTKDKDNETIRMRLRSRNRPLLTKQEPQKIGKKKVIAKIKNIPKRRRKKSLGEKSANTATSNTTSTTDNWKDDLYKFKRSLRLPSKLISMVSPPIAGNVGPDQVSLTSIMNIPQHKKPAKEPKAAKSASHLQMSAAGCKTVKTKRLGHLFGRRDVFKGRRMLKREKIVSAEKLMQRNLRKRRQLKDEEKRDVIADGKIIAPLLDDEDVHIEEDEDDEGDEDDNDNGDDIDGGKPPTRILFKRKFMRKKFRSGFDYIKKKKKKEPASEKKPALMISTTVTPKCVPRYVSDIQAEIKGWIVNKGHGETVLHRASRLGVKDVVGYCIEKLEYAPSVADNAGYTPLHEACSQGHYHIAKLLLQFGADVSASAQGGIRPLHEAVENGDVHLVRLLLSYGADPCLATYSGQSPLSLATDKQTRMLLEHHVNDILGHGSASVWNFEDFELERESEEVDRLLWHSPPSSSATEDCPSFEFEFADQLLPDVYKLSVNAEEYATPGLDADDWVLFADVSAALSVKTVEAMTKLLDDKDAVTSMTVAQFNERAVLRKTLGRQRAMAEKSIGDSDGISTVTATSDEQILLVRYNCKLKQLLGVEAYTVS